MTRKKWRFPAAAAAAAIVLGAVTARADAPARSPFQAPPRQSAEAPRDFGQAIRRLTLKGIVNTETFSRVLVRIGAENEYAVFAPGDRISLDLTGVPHGFTVERIGDKRVVFKDSRGGTHEVCIP